MQMVSQPINSNRRLIEANLDLKSVKAIAQSIFAGGLNYCHIDDILSPSFWDQMFAEYPRMKKTWGLKVIMGEHFDHSETRYKE